MIIFTVAPNWQTSEPNLGAIVFVLLRGAAAVYAKYAMHIMLQSALPGSMEFAKGMSYLDETYTAIRLWVLLMYFLSDCLVSRLQSLTPRTPGGIEIGHHYTFTS